MSSTSTSCPAFCSSYAAVSPAMPAPMTITDESAMLPPMMDDGPSMIPLSIRNIPLSNPPVFLLFPIHHSLFTSFWLIAARFVYLVHNKNDSTTIPLTTEPSIHENPDQPPRLRGQRAQAGRPVGDKRRQAA